MTRLVPLALVALTGACSAPFSAGLGIAGGASEAGAAGVAVSAGTGGGGVTTGGAAGQSAVTGGSGGNVSTGGAGGASATGGAATGLPVDVVPGVATDCVFPSRIDLPPLAPDTCKSIEFSGTCMSYVGDGALPLEFSNLKWDYSTLTLTMDVTVTGTYAMNQGACGSESLCHYRVYFSNTATTTQTTVQFSKTDRGYVGISSSHPQIGSTGEACSTNTTFFDRMTCVWGGYTDYWYALTVPCAN